MPRSETHKNYTKLINLIKVKMDCRKCENRNCFINQNCVNEWLEYVQKIKVKSFLSPHKRIFSEGDIVRGIYIVCDGKVMLSMQTDYMNKEILRLAGPGQILGHRGFHDELQYQVTAETLTQTELAFIEHDEFIKLIRKNADLSDYLILFLGSELLRSDLKHRLQVENYVNKKIEFALKRAYNAFGFEQEEKLTLNTELDIESLANFASVSPEDLIDYFDKLEIEFRLQLEGTKINILDRDYFLSRIATI